MKSLSVASYFLQVTTTRGFENKYPYKKQYLMYSWEKLKKKT